MARTAAGDSSPPAAADKTRCGLFGQRCELHVASDLQSGGAMEAVAGHASAGRELLLLGHNSG
ncbi:hypothetical protein [Streptomyces sp. Act143]|uniref:hypothetical protein n=1 Tax=Streptomyces sp. Act143 TaxID=2200760 RepID=UPI0011B47048|nr:hypothetical protein [Streptomyces sp. Act143]